MNYQIAQILSTAVQVYIVIIIARCLITFFPRVDRSHPVVRGLAMITDPLLEPVARILPPVAGLDLSPVVVIVMLQIFQSVMVSALVGH